jgi:D-aspartate ligase
MNETWMNMEAVQTNPDTSPPDRSSSGLAFSSVSAGGAVQTDAVDPGEQSAQQRKPAQEERPPVIILNLFYTGLGIAHNLRGYGLRVIGLSADRQAHGRFSRFCEARHSPNSQENPAELKNYLLGLAGELQGAIIFPTRDADVLFLDHYREELEQHFRLSIPPRDCLLKVVDKGRLVETAVGASVPVPRTLVVTTREDIVRVGDAVGYPCVVKPVRSADWRGGENWDKVGGRKAFLVQNVVELETEYAQIASVTPEMLIQEWIPGRPDQIVILGGYVGEEGEPLAYFTARKLIQSPEDFGTGCIVESVDLPELLEPTIRLWRALKYRGMAEVEYKRDARTDESKLIEINTRHWDWHRLGMASGVNVSWAAYCDLAGISISKKNPPTLPAKWIAEDATLLYLLRGVYHREVRLRSLKKDLSGRRLYGIFAWSDPLPFIYNLFGVFLPGIFRQVWSKLRAG